MCSRTDVADQDAGAHKPQPRRPAQGRHLLELFALLLGAAITSNAAGAEARYVTDAFKLEARSGPSTRHKIVKILESGMEVEVLGERDDYSRIRLKDGTTAFMLTRYLTPEPSARSRLERALTDLGAEQAKNEALSAERREQHLATERSELERKQLREERDTLAAELDGIKQTAASAIEIRDENQALSKQVDELRGELESVLAKNRALSDTTSQSWFIAGGGVLFAGILMGLIIPKIRWQRRRGWNEL
ncbi:MAG: TIGR04211 family SH3 domain-containing protein [Gammaproteobacteria bacterium]